MFANVMCLVFPMCIVTSCSSVLMVFGMLMFMNIMSLLKSVLIPILGLQTTQPTSGGGVTAVTNCCANCVELSRTQQWGGGRFTVFLGKPVMWTRWMAGAVPHKSR